jgi:hypothetical protein
MRPCLDGKIFHTDNTVPKVPVCVVFRFIVVTITILLGGQMLDEELVHSFREILRGIPYLLYGAPDVKNVVGQVERIKDGEYERGNE